MNHDDDDDDRAPDHTLTFCLDTGFNEVRPSSRLEVHKGPDPNWHRIRGMGAAQAKFLVLTAAESEAAPAIVLRASHGTFFVAGNGVVH